MAINSKDFDSRYIGYASYMFSYGSIENINLQYIFVYWGNAPSSMHHYRCSKNAMGIVYIKVLAKSRWSRRSLFSRCQCIFK